MSDQHSYPRVLIVALGRINEADTYNNGLLLRNLFGGEWPRDNLAQIFSSGNTGDRGFCGRYYELGPNDRFLGSIFSRLKKVAQPVSVNPISTANVSLAAPNRKPTGAWLRQALIRLLVHTGVYELIFRPRLSTDLQRWVEAFKPDVILAQGYNLTFSWLPVLLKQATGARLAVLATDDWPKYLYMGMHGEPQVLRRVMRPIVERAALDLFRAADVPFAFGEPMAIEYAKRYGKAFISITHADDPLRFQCSPAACLKQDASKTVVAVGTLNEFRWPLLLDANAACEELARRGIAVRVVIVSSAIAESGRKALANAAFIDVLPDPGNNLLPSYLKGADALLLAEGFDDEFVSAIELSVSSKSHLFMFSRRPILVYAAARTGVARYAREHQWAEVIDERSVGALAAALQRILEDHTTASALVARADAVALRNHTHATNQARFADALSARCLS